MTGRLAILTLAALLGCTNIATWAVMACAGAIPYVLVRCTAEAVSRYAAERARNAARDRHDAPREPGRNRWNYSRPATARSQP